MISAGASRGVDVDMQQNFDAIIIGAGIIGAAIAFEMARGGRRTLNIDRLPAAGYGSTSHSCAIIRVYYSTVDATALACDSYFHWKDWAGYLGAEDERGHAVFHDCGTLVMKTEQNGHCRRSMAIMSELGIPFEEWDAERIRETLPPYDLAGFAPAKRMEDDDFGKSNGSTIDGAVFFPQGGYVSDPQLATHNLQRAAEAHGAAFRFNAEVTEILREDGRVGGVRLADGSRITAPIVINVAGPHSAKINAMAGVTGDMAISTRPLRQEVVHLASPGGFDFQHRGTVVSDSDIAVYCRPETGNNILVGSEDPPCDVQEEVDPDDFDRTIGPQGVTQAFRYAQRVPGIEVPNRPRGVVDLYDVTEDWGPIYDRSSLDGFYMAIGTSGNQFKNAPVVGRMMTALVDYCEGGNDHDAKPLTFRLTHIDHTLDLANVSRRRRINPDSSFSVLG